MALCLGAGSLPDMPTTCRPLSMADVTRCSQHSSPSLTDRKLHRVRHKSTYVSQLDDSVDVSRVGMFADIRIDPDIRLSVIIIIIIIIIIN